MKSHIMRMNKQAGFTIFELLTVMSIIVTLISLLVPSLNQVKRYAYEVKQRAQLKGIDTAIELFNSEFDGYPDSSPIGPDGAEFCGAMKLAEAVMGQDLMGFHPDSVFRSDGLDGTGKALYPDANTVNPVTYRDSLCIRKGPYLPLEGSNAFAIGDLYSNSGPFKPWNIVLCDVFKRVTHRTTGKKIGMPILYYKANTANFNHNITNPDDPRNVYSYLDNQSLLALGKPWENNLVDSSPHRLAIENGQAGVRFYMNTRNHRVATASRPHRANTYILISAGFDGEYGTPDDICNFEWKFLEMQ